MSKLSIASSSLIILIYILILVAPNFLLGTNWILIILLFLIYIFLYSLTNLKVFYTLTFPILIISLIQLIYYINIHQSLVSALLIEISLFASSGEERLSIITDYIFIFIICILVLLLLWKKSKKIKISRSASLSLLAIILFTSIISIYNTKESINYKRKHTDNKYHFKTIALMNVKEVFPLNFIRNIWTAHLTHKKSTTYLKQTENFSFGFSKINNNENDIILLIIGESSRASSFGLNNTKTPTTPKLQKRNNLISFKNAFSPYSSTARSVPFALSRVPKERWKQNMYNEKSIVSAMKELGYETFCIDNQVTNRGLLDYYKNEVEVYIPTKKAMSYDDNIIPILDSIIQFNPKPKKFILIHTYGSHYTYSSRYPREMAKFTPDQSTGMDVKYKKEINNAYLNTIHYVDYFLDEVIKKIEPYKSSFIYFSDHGENLYDDEQNLIFHGYTTPNRHTLNIPIIFWYSNAKKTEKPNLLVNATLNQYKLISTESIFSSVLNLTLLDSSLYKTNSSFLHKDLKSLDDIRYFDENNNLQILE